MDKYLNLKINLLSKQKLNSIKETYSFSTFSSAIETMCTFFEVNKISPKEGVNQSYQNAIFNVEKAVKVGLFDLKKQYNNDSQSMRKLLRAIEKDHMINMSSKISYLYDKTKEKSVDESVKNSFNSVVESSKEDLEKDKEIELLKDLLEDKKNEIKQLKYAHENDDTLATKYFESLKTIYQNMKLEKSPLGKEKIVINMTRESFDKLFDI